MYGKNSLMYGKNSLMYGKNSLVADESKIFQSNLYTQKSLALVDSVNYARSQKTI